MRAATTTTAPARVMPPGLSLATVHAALLLLPGRRGSRRLRGPLVQLRHRGLCAGRRVRCRPLRTEVRASAGEAFLFCFGWYVLWKFTSLAASLGHHFCLWRGAVVNRQVVVWKGASFSFLQL